MMYPFMTLNDETEIVHSDMNADGTVKVYIETPDKKDGFHNMTCYLPTYEIKEINGYSDKQVEEFRKNVLLFEKQEIKSWENTQITL